MHPLIAATKTVTCKGKAGITYIFILVHTYVCVYIYLFIYLCTGLLMVEDIQEYYKLLISYKTPEIRKEKTIYLSRPGYMQLPLEFKTKFHFQADA
jgi:hypothetical protein